MTARRPTRGVGHKRWSRLEAQHLKHGQVLIAVQVMQTGAREVYLYVDYTAQQYNTQRTMDRMACHNQIYMYNNNLQSIQPPTTTPYRSLLGVVSSLSPSKMLFAPAKKHMA